MYAEETIFCCIHLSSYSGLISCNSHDRLKEKIFNQQIVAGKIKTKIMGQRGDFYLIYADSNLTDTVTLFGYYNYFDQIDSETIITKTNGTYFLALQRLKRANNKRYADRINLIYW